MKSIKKIDVLLLAKGDHDNESKWMDLVNDDDDDANS